MEVFPISPIKTMSEYAISSPQAWVNLVSINSSSLVPKRISDITRIATSIGCYTPLKSIWMTSALITKIRKKSPKARVFGDFVVDDALTE